MRDANSHYVRGESLRTPEGRSVGRIDRVVFDPVSRKVTHLVVRKGSLLPKARVVPVRDVEETEHGVTVRQGVDTDSFPEFEKSDYVIGDESAYYQRNPQVAIGPYGPVGAANADLHRHRERNLPEEAIAIKSGANVISSDGQKVGRLDEVIVDADSGLPIQLVLRMGRTVKATQTVPANLIISVDENDIYLALDANSLDDL